MSHERAQAVEGLTTRDSCGDRAAGSANLRHLHSAIPSRGADWPLAGQLQCAGNVKRFDVDMEYEAILRVMDFTSPDTFLGIPVPTGRSRRSFWNVKSIELGEIDAVVLVTELSSAAYPQLENDTLIRETIPRRTNNRWGCHVAATTQHPAGTYRRDLRSA